jgi:hypothetical protein
MARGEVIRGQPRVRPLLGNMSSLGFVLEFLDSGPEVELHEALSAYSAWTQDDFIQHLLELNILVVGNG